MTNTVCTILLSIVEVKDPQYISAKISLLERELTLTEVEKKIVKDIKESISVGSPVTTEFIKDKYSFYVESDSNVLGTLLGRDSIDSAITDIKVSQLRTMLAKELVELGSDVKRDLDINELRSRIGKLTSHKLVTRNTQIPENELKVKTNAYAEVTAEGEGLDYPIQRIEHFAGKAIPGTVIGILAFAGGFKSTFALNLAYTNAARGKNMLYLILEDTGLNIVDRVVINHIACTALDRSELIDATWVRDNKLLPDQIKHYNKKHNELATKYGKHLLMWDSAKLEYHTFPDMTNLLRDADNLFKKETGRGIDGVIIDQLSLLKYTDITKKYSYTGEILNEWVSYFRKQALKFLDEDRQIVVFLISQINRESYMEASKPKKKGRYDITCAAEANELERALATMITLYKDLDTRDTVLINIPKSRRGMVPENPIQVEAYGNYFHFGPLNLKGEQVTLNDFMNNEVKFEDLIK